MTTGMLYQASKAAQYLKKPGADRATPGLGLGERIEGGTNGYCVTKGQSGSVRADETGR